MVTSWKVKCGIARYSEELVSALKQFRDCQVKVIPAGVQVWSEERRAIGWLMERKYWRRVAKEAEGSEIIHIQFAPHFFGGLKPFRNLMPFFLRLLSNPTIVTVHEIDLTGSPLMRFVKIWVQKGLFRSENVKKIITLTSFAANQLRQLGYEMVTVIPMWVSKLEQVLSGKEAKERLNLSGKFVVTAFGFIVPRRGYEILLDALKFLPEDTLLVFAGGPHPLDRTGYYSKLLARIAESPRRNQVYVTGYLPDDEVDLWLSASDVIVAPFRYLSGSASLMRAIAHGKPIVASNLPPLKELADLSGALVLVPIDDPTAFAEAIKSLKKPTERLPYEQAAKEFANRQNVQSVAEKHIKLYNAILRNKLTNSVLS